VSPGIDQITVKLMQAQGEIICSEINIYIYIYILVLSGIRNNCLNRGRKLLELFLKSAKRDSSNYRGIILL